MKNRKGALFFLLLFLLGLGWWAAKSHHPSNPVVIKSRITKAQMDAGQKTEPSPTKEEALASPEIQEILKDTNTTPELKEEIATNPIAALMRIRAAQGIWDRENNTPINFYGRVVDQNGQPIGDVQVEMGVMLYGGFTQSKSQTYNTVTDSQGGFSFIGLHGVDFGFNFKKEGYFYDLKLSSKRPENYYSTNTNHPLVFPLWKLQGAELMIRQSLVLNLPCDGTKTVIDLISGKVNSPESSLIVKLERNPVQIIRGKPFEWTFTMTVPGGGLIEMDDPYPYEAPESGYHETVVIATGANPQHYIDAAKKSYYYKSAEGKYGRLTIDLQADFQPPPTFLGISIYLNPSGSRNLEFDSKKQIKLP